MGSSSQFAGANNFVIKDSHISQHYHNQGGLSTLFNASLPDASQDAGARESAPRCLPGTREKHIADTIAWAHGTANRHFHMFWMHGPAGVGKSAVAQTCAERIKQAGGLGAAFFFSRLSNIEDPTRFFPSIVYQLTTSLPEYRDLVSIKIQTDQGLVSKSIEVQFQELIVAPFQDLKARGRDIGERVILVDGLDECDSEDAQCKIIAMVAQSIRKRTTPLIWAFFSRPEPHLSSTFGSEVAGDLCQQVPLPVRAPEANKAIKLYLQDGFKAIRGRHGIPHSPPWPSEEDIDKLVFASAGLFLYAATVLRFIGDRDHRPAEQFRVVLGLLGGRSPTSSGSPFSGIDKFYALIMQRVFSSTLPETQLLLLAAVIFQENASEVLNNLLGFDLQSFYKALHHLHSVVSLEETDSGRPTIFFYHVSFVEFLLDRSRSGEYCITSPNLFATLLKKCLRVINHAHNTTESDNPAPNIPLSHDISPMPLTNLKWLVYKSAIKNLFKLCLLADLDSNPNLELDTLDFRKVSSFTERHGSGVWQAYDSDLIKKVSQKNDRLIRPHRPFFSLGSNSRMGSFMGEANAFPTYVVGQGKRKAYLVPRKHTLEKTQYVLAPNP